MNLQQKKDIQVKGLNSIQFWLNWVFNKKKHPIDFISILFADKEDPWGNWGEIFPSDNPFTVQIFLIPFSPIQILLTFDPFPWLELEFLRSKIPTMKSIGYQLPGKARKSVQDNVKV